GLNSLIGSQADDHAADDAPVPQIVAAEFMQIDAATIERNPYQPRQVFDQPALDELKESIIQHGILQPLLVRKVETGFQLVAGERRLIAAKNAGLRTVPCKVAELDDRAVCEVAIMENLQREDLSGLEKGEAFHAYLERF